MNTRQISSINQIEVGSAVIVDFDGNKRYVRAIADNMVALSNLNQPEGFEGWYSIDHIMNCFTIEDAPRKPKWKPKEGQEYFIPDLREETLCFMQYWENKKEDKLLFKRGLCYQTIAEAVERAERMLNQSN